jgi:hypothetical protein
MSALPWEEGPARLKEDSLTSWQGQEDANEILTMSGECPRCSHESTWEIPASTVVVTASAAVAPGSTASEAQYKPTTLFKCLCPENHRHPARMQVTGCGAYWVAKPRKGASDLRYRLEPVREPSLVNAATLVAKESESAQGGLRTLAEKWVPGIAAIISVLGLAGVVVSKDAVNALSQGWRIAAFTLVAVAVIAAAVATALVYRAAFGWPEVVSLDTDSDVLAAATRISERNIRIVERLQDAVVLSGVAVLALLGGLAIFWLQPDSTHPVKVTYTVSGSTSSICGMAGDIKDGKLAVEVTEGSTTTTEQVDLSAVTKLEQVSSCGG